MSVQPGFVPFVHKLGEGPRRVLALHCTMAFGGAWGGMAKVLGDLLTFVAPDLPSHGRSAEWDGQSDFPQTVFDTTLAQMDAAPMDVIGHSFGAVTALRLAARHPERVRSLTLFEPVFFAVAKADAPDTLVDHDRAAKPFQIAIAAGDMPGAARAFNGMWATERGTWDKMPERSRMAMARAIHVVPSTYALLYDDTDGILAPGVLARLKMPVTLVRGALTHEAVRATLNGLHSRIPGSVVEVIPDAGHMAPISHPQAMAAVFETAIARA